MSSFQAQPQPGGSSSSLPELDPELEGISKILQLIGQTYRAVQTQQSQTPDYDLARVGVMIDNVTKKVERLREKNTSSHDAKLKEFEAICEELKRKVICLETELALCWEEIETLKRHLEEERKGRHEANLKWEGHIKKIEEEFAQVQENNSRLEERLNALEIRHPLPPPPAPPTPSSSDNIGSEVMSKLDSISNELQAKITELNDRQIKLHEEVGGIKEFVENQSATHRNVTASEAVESGEGTSSTTTGINAPPQTPSSSPVLDVEASAMFLIKLEPVSITDGTIPAPSSLAPDLPPPAVTLPPIVAVPGPSNNNPDAPLQGDEQCDSEPSSPSLLDPVGGEVNFSFSEYLNDIIGDTTSGDVNSTQAISKRKAKWFKEHRVDNPLQLTCICDTDFRFKNERNLNEHIKLYTTVHYFACPICFNSELNCYTRTYRHLKTLRLHLKNAHNAVLQGNQVVGCPKCGEILSSLSQLRTSHLKNCNPSMELYAPAEVIIHGKESEVTSDDGYSVRCHCGSRFESSSAIMEHIQYFTAECTFACEWKGCGGKFREQEELQGHMQNNHGQRTIQSIFSQSAPTSQNSNLCSETPTKSAAFPGAFPTHPSTQQASKEGKRTAQDVQSGSGNPSPSSSAKRARINYPVRRASTNTMKPSSPANGQE